MNIIENLENLNVSEECFNDIMSLIEGIMDNIKAGMDAEDAKKKWAKDKNDELQQAKKESETAARVYKQALKGWKRKSVPSETVDKLRNKSSKAHSDYLRKYKTNIKANFSNVKGVKGQMDLPPHTDYEHKMNKG